MAGPERKLVSRRVHRGREYATYSDGSQWTCKLDQKTGEPLGEWTAVEAPPGKEEDETPGVPTRQLSLVVENQAEGEPKHWSLFSHFPNDAGSGSGQVWQVKGDAELMHYEHASDADMLASECFAWHQVLNNNLGDAQLARVDEIARSEPAPRAASRAAVTEHCQGWTIRVLSRLAKEGIVEESAVIALRQYMDPIR